MLKSMTGYGSGEWTQDGRRAVVEMKAVNHKFVEYAFRVPKRCAFLEERLRTAMQGRVFRGKVELSVSLSFQKRKAYRSLSTMGWPRNMPKPCGSLPGNTEPAHIFRGGAGPLPGGPPGSTSPFGRAGGLAGSTAGAGAGAGTVPLDARAGREADAGRYPAPGGDGFASLWSRWRSVPRRR